VTQIRVLAALFVLVAATFGQATEDGQFRLSLPERDGQLRWSAPGFKVNELSAKSNGNEIGIRGSDEASKVSFLGFLFVFSELAPLSSAKCRDGILGPEKNENPTLKIISTSEYGVSPALPASLVTYTTKGATGKTSYMVRGFIATGEVCGDLEFYSDTPLSADDPLLKGIFASYGFDETYVPKYKDAFLYAQILYDHHMYAAAGPRFELALAKLREQPEGDVKTMTRVLTDQAGMAYGISGNISKARALFEKAIVEDPDYPLYYYNLACADAEEKNLVAARDHLQKAFERKANVLKGESMPDPTKDDSFLPYRSNKDFWAFVKSLR
jgi:hypothetical protein